MKNDKNNLTMVIGEDEGVYIGYIREIPIINFQGKSIKEVERNILKTLREVMDSRWPVSLELWAGG